ncbi:MAG TPA: aldo/keto reductase [Geminicoccaceae bacterium]|nr:aldo/keto reductase [Geminicoccaceae bacterium]
MKQRRFGRTGWQISELTLGGGIVGGILIHPPEEVRLEALRRVVAAGCDWIDTAADYGQGESERTLGRLLPEIEPRPRLSTKVRLDLDRGDLEGQIRASLEASLTRLRLDRVELFQLHNGIMPETGGGAIGVREVLGPGGVADIFDRLRDEGYFRCHGITALGDTATLIEVLRSGRFDTAQVYHNMLNPSAARPMPPGWGGQDFGGLIAACKAQDVGIMNIRVLAAGVLATEVRHGREGAITSGTDIGSEEIAARRIFARLGDAHGTRAQTAIRHALANPDLSTVVVGLATLDHLDEALAAFAAGPLPDAAMAELEAVYAEGWPAPSRR